MKSIFYCFVLLVLGATAAHSITYKTTVIGNYGNDISITPVKITNRGQILFRSYYSAETSGGYHHSIWSADKGFIGIENISNDVIVGNMNSQGQIVGLNPYEGTSFIREVDGSLNELTCYPMNSIGFAYDINDKGSIAGSSSTKAIIWKDAGSTPISIWDGEPGKYVDACYVNNSGQAVYRVNYMPIDVFGRQSFIWDDNLGIRELKPLNGETQSGVYELNDFGQSTGISGNHAVLWDANGNPTDLGIGMAYDINNKGQVVGMMNGHGTLWNPDGTTVQLDKNICGLNSMHINDNGQIVGSISDPINASSYAVLWTPEVPEPGSLIALTLGLAPLAGIALRKRHK